MSLYLHGMGHFHPPTIIDNAFLEALDIGTSNDWILERVGIRERRTVLPLDYIRDTRNADLRAADEAALCSSLDLAERAAELALKRAGISARDIGLVVAGGCCPGANLPSDAARLAACLQMLVPTFDLNAGCSSFGAQLHVLGAMQAALPDYVLVVNAEATTRVVDYAERSAAVLWGDCATAAVVSPRVAAPLRLTGSGIDGDPRGAAAVSIPRFGHFTQQGSAVQRFAIKTMSSCLRRSLERFSAQPGAGAIPVASVVDERGRQHAGVNDEHGLDARSAPTSSAAATRPPDPRLGRGPRRGWDARPRRSSGRADTPGATGSPRPRGAGAPRARRRGRL